MTSQQNGTPKIEAEAQDLNSGIQSQTKIWITRIPEPLPLEKYPVFRLPAVLEEVIKKDFLDRQNNFNSELPVFKSNTDIITTFKLEFEDYDSKVMESNDYSNGRNKEERQVVVGQTLAFLCDLFNPFYNQMAPVLHILGLEAPSLNMPSRDLVDYVNELNTLVSDFHRNAPNYSFGDFSLDYCTTDTLLAILEISKRCADVGSLRGGATGAKVFGNLSEKQMAVTCGELNIGEKDRFIDIGCGYGQLMCTVAALTGAEESAGIEYHDHIYNAGVLHLQFFKSLMKFFGKRHGNIKIEYGDVTEEKNHSMVTSSTFIFANNIAFRDLNDQLKKIFLNCRNSTQIVSTDPFFSMRTSGKEGKFDTHFNKKDELFKICKVRSVKEKQLEVVEENTGWKTESTKLYLITIEGKVTLKEKEPVEEMEFEETPSENIRDNGRGT
ncbi:hypothetical protein L5515_013540 [Caenorhabditis briggsae]|uniref:Histone-lysine N-methyltransferase, H3 lysine-79 specific n=1 Tax=Caenorhabditis briggsae TaxID=6238 RepID=A0AAE9E9D6_CAEBR|nr:hypothetical protein L5515_013540 [Caenorhabditis briggsae]